MSESGQNRKSATTILMSVIPPKAEVIGRRAVESVSRLYGHFWQLWRSRRSGATAFTLRLAAVMLVMEASGPMRVVLQSWFFALAIMALTVPADAGPYEDGVEAAGRGDYTTALKFWRPLAEQGHAVAQSHLGYMYENGKGVQQDNAEAAKWYRKAARQGVAEAQFKLGLMYDTGESVPQDYVEAVKWYRMAAEQGDATAQNNLGVSYAIGAGVPQDYVIAHMWFNLAAARGHKRAQEGRDIAASNMTPDQIDEAQHMTREWQEKHQQ